MRPVGSALKGAARCGLALGLATLGCAGNSVTPFPPGLAPLAVDNAPAPSPDAQSTHPQKLNVITGSTSSYDFADASGYLSQPISRVWQALGDPKTAIDPKVSSVKYDVGIEPQYAVSFVLHCTENDFITVEWDVTWRADVVAGTPDAPITIAARYQKTSGTDFISLLEGSVTFQKIDEQTTAVDAIEEISATDTDASEAARYLNAYYQNLLAWFAPTKP
jgi:hypothetical protein